MISRSRFFDIGAGIYDVLTDQEIWRRNILQAAEHLGPLAPDSFVLDLGCGQGISTFMAGEKLGPDVAVVGLDFAPGMIRLARDHHRSRHAHLENVQFVLGDLLQAPFAPETFDAAMGHSFLYLIPDRHHALREIRRVLKPGGRLVLVEPHAEGSLPRATLWAVRHARALATHPLQILRFATSMAAWRIVSRVAGQISAGQAESLLGDAGFDDISSREVLGGLALLITAAATKALAPMP